MSRAQRNDVDYFPHSVVHRKKMFYIKSKYKNDGYAVWFQLLEELGKANYHYLDLKDITELMYLSSSLQVPESMLEDIILDLVKLREFDADLWEKERILFNEKFIDSIRDAYKKRQNSCIDRNSLIQLLTDKGRLKAPLRSPKEIKGKLEVSINPQRKEENRKEEESNTPSPFLNSEEEDSQRVKEATNHIAKFFGIGEIAQSGSFIKIANFCRYQESKGRIELLADQFTAYRKLKSKEPQFKHNWKTWMGTPENSYEDGKWNEQDWKTKLKTDEPATTTTTDYAAIRQKTLERIAN